MDGVVIAGIAGGVPSLTFILLAVQVGRWHGRVDEMLKGQERRMDINDRRAEKFELNFNESMKEQRKVCFDQKEACAKVMDHVSGRINGIVDK